MGLDCYNCHKENTASTTSRGNKGVVQRWDLHNSQDTILGYLSRPESGKVFFDHLHLRDLLLEKDLSRSVGHARVVLADEFLDEFLPLFAALIAAEMAASA